MRICDGALLVMLGVCRCLSNPELIGTNPDGETDRHGARRGFRGDHGHSRRGVGEGARRTKHQRKRGRMTMEKRLETITVDRIAQNMAGMDRHELRAHAGVALSTAYFTGYRHWASNVSQEPARAIRHQAGPFRPFEDRKSAGKDRLFVRPGCRWLRLRTMFRMTAMAGASEVPPNAFAPLPPCCSPHHIGVSEDGCKGGGEGW